ncbi:Acid-sensing ion channel 4 [Lamellibrachia satsuma]|nr:Acid-sensing ion channel 4 [Lamellibrachia satsuma]
MPIRCRWKGTPCSHEDFQETVTDAGVCYTFNARNSSNSTIDATGVTQGLQLVLNIEQYEYMKGPHNAVGLKLVLHQQDAIPLVQDFGDNVPAGMHTFVGVSVSKETNLPPPHGDCVRHKKLRYFSRYSQAACYRECVTDFVVEKCGCRDYYMPHIAYTG